MYPLYIIHTYFCDSPRRVRSLHQVGTDLRSLQAGCPGLVIGENISVKTYKDNIKRTTIIVKI